MLIGLSAGLGLYCGMIGLLFGSFFNVCAYRIPRRESVVFGRSHCPDCNHPLGPSDLVPVFSYLALGRRCRYCHRTISPRYAIVEALTAVLFILSGFVIGAIGLTRGTPIVVILLLCVLDITVLSVIWLQILIGQSRQGKAEKSDDQSYRFNRSLAKPFLWLLLADLAHLALIWAIWR